MCALVCEKEQRTISIYMIFGCLSDGHVEHDRLGSHRGHLIAKAIPIDTVHVCSKGVLATGLSLTGIDDLLIRTDNLVWEM